MTNVRRLPEKMEPATLLRSVRSLEGRHPEPVLVGLESAVYSRYMFKHGFRVCCVLQVHV